MKKKIFLIIGIILGSVTLFTGAVFGVLALRGKLKKNVMYPDSLVFEIDDSIVSPSSVALTTSSGVKLYSFTLTGTNESGYKVNRPNCELWFVEGEDLITLCDEKGNKLEAKDGRYKIKCNTPIYYYRNEDIEENGDVFGKVVLEARDEKKEHKSNPITLWLDKEVTNLSLGEGNLAVGKSQVVTIGKNEALDFVFSSNDNALRPISDREQKNVEIYYDYGKADILKIKSEELTNSVHPLFEKMKFVNGIYTFETDELGEYEFRIAVFPTYYAQDNAVHQEESNKSRTEKMVYTDVTVRVVETAVKNVDIEIGTMDLSLFLPNYIALNEDITGEGKNFNLGLTFETKSAEYNAEDLYKTVKFFNEDDLDTVAVLNTTDNKITALSSGIDLGVENNEFTYKDETKNIEFVFKNCDVFAAGIHLLKLTTEGYAINGGVPVAVKDGANYYLKLLKTNVYLQFLTVDDTTSWNDYIVSREDMAKPFKIIPTSIPAKSVQLQVFAINSDATFATINKDADEVSETDNKIVSVYVNEIEQTANNISFKDGETSISELDLTITRIADKNEHVESLKFSEIVDLSEGISNDAFVFVTDEDGEYSVNVQKDYTITSNNKTYVLVGLMVDGKYVNEIRAEQGLYNKDILYPLQLNNKWNGKTEDRIIYTAEELINDLKVKTLSGKLFNKTLRVDVDYNFTNVMSGAFEVEFTGSQEDLDKNSNAVVYVNDNELKTVTITITDTKGIIGKLAKKYGLGIEENKTALNQFFKVYNAGSDPLVENTDLKVSSLTYNANQETYTLTLNSNKTISGVILKLEYGGAVYEFDKTIKVATTAPIGIEYKLSDTKTISLSKESANPTEITLTINGYDNGYILDNKGLTLNENDDENGFNVIGYGTGYTLEYSTSGTVFKIENNQIKALSVGEQVLKVTAVINDYKLDTYVKIKIVDDTKFSLTLNGISTESENVRKSNTFELSATEIKYAHDNNPITDISENTINVSIEVVEFGLGATEIEENIVKFGEDTVLSWEYEDSEWTFTRVAHTNTPLKVKVTVSTKTGESATFTLTFNPSVSYYINKAWQDKNQNMINLYAGSTIVLYEMAEAINSDWEYNGLIRIVADNNTLSNISVETYFVTIDENNEEVRTQVEKDGGEDGNQATIKFDKIGKYVVLIKNGDDEFAEIELNVKPNFYYEEDSKDIVSGENLYGTEATKDFIIKNAKVLNTGNGVVYGDGTNMYYEKGGYDLAKDFNGATTSNIQFKLDENPDYITTAPWVEKVGDKATYSFDVYYDADGEGTSHDFTKVGKIENVTVNNPYRGVKLTKDGEEISTINGVYNISVLDEITVKLMPGETSVTISSITADGLTFDGGKLKVTSHVSSVTKKTFEFVMIVSEKTVTWTATFNVSPYLPLKETPDKLYNGEIYTSEQLISKFLNVSDSNYTNNIDSIKVVINNQEITGNYDLTDKVIKGNSEDLEINFNIIYKDNDSDSTNNVGTSYKITTQIWNKEEVKLTNPYAQTLRETRDFYDIKNESTILESKENVSYEPVLIGMMNNTSYQTINFVNDTDLLMSRAEVVSRKDQTKLDVSIASVRLKAQALTFFNSCTENNGKYEISLTNGGKVIVEISGTSVTFSSSNVVAGNHGFLMFEITSSGGATSDYIVRLYSQNGTSYDNDFVNVTNGHNAYVEITSNTDENVKFNSLLDKTFYTDSKKVTTNLFKDIFKLDISKNSIKNNIHFYITHAEMLNGGDFFREKDYKLFDDVTQKNLPTVDNFASLRVAMVYKNGDDVFSIGFLRIQAQPDFVIKVGSEIIYNGQATMTIKSGATLQPVPFTVTDKNLSSVESVEIIDNSNFEAINQLTTDGTFKIIHKSSGDEILTIDTDSSSDNFGTIIINKDISEDLSFKVKYTYGDLVLYATYLLEGKTYVPNGSIEKTVGEFITGDFNNKIEISSLLNYYNRRIKVTSGKNSYEVDLGNETAKQVINNGEEVTNTATEINEDSPSYSIKNNSISINLISGKLYFIFTQGVKTNTEILDIELLDYIGNSNLELKTTVLPKYSLDSETVSSIKNTTGSPAVTDFTSVNGSYVEISVSTSGDITTFSIGGENGYKIYADNGATLELIEEASGNVGSEYYYMNTNDGSTDIKVEEEASTKTRTATITSSDDGEKIYFAHLADVYALNLTIRLKDSSDPANYYVKYEEGGNVKNLGTISIDIIPTYHSLESVYTVTDSIRDLINSLEIENIYSYLFGVRTDSAVNDIVPSPKTNSIFNNYRVKLVTATVTEEGENEEITYNYPDYTYSGMGFGDVKNPNYIRFGTNKDFYFTGNKLTFKSDNTEYSLNLVNNAGLDSFEYKLLVKTSRDLTYNTAYNTTQFTQGIKEDAEYISYVINDTDESKEFRFHETYDADNGELIIDDIKYFASLPDSNSNFYISGLEVKYLLASTGAEEQTATISSGISNISREVDGQSVTYSFTVSGINIKLMKTEGGNLVVAFNRQASISKFNTLKLSFTMYDNAGKLKAYEILFNNYKFDDRNEVTEGGVTMTENHVLMAGSNYNLSDLINITYADNNTTINVSDLELDLTKSYFVIGKTRVDIKTNVSDSNKLFDLIKGTGTGIDQNGIPADDLQIRLVSVPEYISNVELVFKLIKDDYHIANHIWRFDVTENFELKFSALEETDDGYIQKSEDELKNNTTSVIDLNGMINVNSTSTPKDSFPGIASDGSGNFPYTVELAELFRFKLVDLRTNTPMSSANMNITVDEIVVQEYDEVDGKTTISGSYEDIEKFVSFDSTDNTKLQILKDSVREVKLKIQVPTYVGLDRLVNDGEGFFIYWTLNIKGFADFEGAFKETMTNGGTYYTPFQKVDLVSTPGDESAFEVTEQHGNLSWNTTGSKLEYYISNTEITNYSIIEEDDWQDTDNLNINSAEVSTSLPMHTNNNADKSYYVAYKLTLNYKEQDAVLICSYYVRNTIVLELNTAEGSSVDSTKTMYVDKKTEDSTQYEEDESKTLFYYMAEYNSGLRLYIKYDTDSDKFVLYETTTGTYFTETNGVYSGESENEKYKLDENFENIYLLNDDETINTTYSRTSQSFSGLISHSMNASQLVSFLNSVESIRFKDTTRNIDFALKEVNYEMQINLAEGKLGSVALNSSTNPLFNNSMTFDLQIETKEGNVIDVTNGNDLTLKSHKSLEPEAEYAITDLFLTSQVPENARGYKIAGITETTPTDGSKIQIKVQNNTALPADYDSTVSGVEVYGNYKIYKYQLTDSTVGDKFYTITRDIYVVAGASEIVKVAYEGLGNETFNVLYNKGKDSSYDLSNTLIKWSMGTGDNEGKLLSAQIDSDVTYALNPSETNISLQLENNTTFIVIAHDKLIEYKKMYPEKDYWKVEVIATYSSKEYKLSFSFELPSTIEINPATSDYTLETISQNGNINSYYKVDIAEMLYENVTEPPALLKDSDNTLSVEEDEEKSNYLAEHEQVSSESFNIYLDKTAVDMYFNAYPSETTLSIDLKLNVKVDGELKQSYDFTLVVEKSKLPKDTTVEE